MKKLLTVTALCALVFVTNAEAKRRPRAKVIDCIVNSYACENQCFSQQQLCSYRCRGADSACVDACENGYYSCKASCGLNTCGYSPY